MSTQTATVGNQEAANTNRMNNSCPSPVFSSPDIDESIYNQQKTNHEALKESFNSSMNNSSGLGDSILLPSYSGECSSSSSSVYGVNVNQSSSDSMPDTPVSPSSYMKSAESQLINSQKYNQKSDAVVQKATLNNQKSIPSEFSSPAEYSSSKNNQFGNNLSQQMNSMNINQIDYDPFNDYMGMDKMVLQSDGQKSKVNFEQQQQIIAQALAAVASSSNSNSTSGLTNTNESQGNLRSTTRSLTENIELLNSKFMSHKNQNISFSNSDRNSEKSIDGLNTNSITSLLATVAAQNTQNQSSNLHGNLDSHPGYGSVNMPVNLKRQSYPLSNQQQGSNQILGGGNNSNLCSNLNSNLMNGSSNQSSIQSGLNSRLNSTPNLYNSNGSNGLPSDQNQINNRSSVPNASMQNSEKQPGNSMSASNSSFNFNLNSNDLDGSSTSRNHLGQISSSANNSSSSCYDDDEVFSTNSSFSSSIQQPNRSTDSNNSNANNFDSFALAQLYRNFMSNNASNVNSNNNRSDTNNSNNSNINELLSNYNANLAALSINTDLLNSSSFLNSTNSMASQLKTLNSTNSNNLNSNYGNRSNNSANLDQIAAAVLKQRQALMNTNRSSASMSGHVSSNPSSNIAALTSATSNIASLLNLNNGNGSQTNQQNQHNFMDSGMKRRVNSSNFNINSGNSSNNPSSQQASSLYGNNNLFNTNVGPNASQLLQNSSLASSARLNSATSSSAAASVLGNNSSLHALSSLQHQSGVNSSQGNHNNLFNSNSMNSGSNSNNGNNGGLQQHQSNLLNFNMSPSASSNHGILSALSLSSTTGNSLQNQLLSASGKPLRSERLPSHIVEEIVKQAKIRRRNGGKKEVCVFCRNNGEKEQIYTSHTLKDASNRVACPILRLYQCPICHASGDQAHTIKYCPYAEKDSNCIKLFKENGRMSAAAAFLMNSLAGSNTSPSLSPPSTPPPSHNGGHSLMSQNTSLDMSSPSPHNSLNAYLNSGLNFNMGLGKNNDLGSNLNKSFSNCSSMFPSSSASNNAAAANAANSVLTSRDTNSSLLSSNFTNNLNK